MQLKFGIKMGVSQRIEAQFSEGMQTRMEQENRLPINVDKIVKQLQASLHTLLCYQAGENVLSQERVKQSK